MMASLNEFEVETIKSRVFPSMIYSVAEKGRYQGSRYVAYGYFYDKPNKELKIVDEEAEQVKLIYKYYTEGIGNDINVGQLIIARHLNQQGYRYRDGSEWTSRRISNILNNEMYTGTYVWNKKGTEFKTIETDDLTEIKYEFSKRSKDPRPVIVSYEKSKNEIVRRENALPKIIDYATWKLAQDKLERNSINKNKNKNLDFTRQTSHLLSNILVCPDCKGRMTASKMSNGIYYKCQRANHSGTCDFNMVKEDYLLPAIYDVFFTFLELHIKRVLPNMLIESLLTTEGLKMNEDSRILELEEKRKRHIDLISDAFKESRLGDLDKSVYEDIRDKSNKEIKLLDKEIETINKQKKENNVNQAEINLLSDKLTQFKDLEEYYNSLDIYGKIELLSRIIHHVEYEKIKGRRGKKSIKITKFVLHYNAVGKVDNNNRRKELLKNNPDLVER
ncbi:hypothetical protein D7X33_34405, partial [Butyricicoccus sp. 1XD8-22]